MQTPPLCRIAASMSKPRSTTPSCCRANPSSFAPKKASPSCSRSLVFSRETTTLSMRWAPMTALVRAGRGVKQGNRRRSDQEQTAQAQERTPLPAPLDSGGPMIRRSGRIRLGAREGEGVRRQTAERGSLAGLVAILEAIVFMSGPLRSGGRAAVKAAEHENHRHKVRAQAHGEDYTVQKLSGSLFAAVGHGMRPTAGSSGWRVGGEVDRVARKIAASANTP